MTGLTLTPTNNFGQANQGFFIGFAQDFQCAADSSKPNGSGKKVPVISTFSPILSISAPITDETPDTYSDKSSSWISQTFSNALVSGRWQELLTGSSLAASTLEKFDYYLDEVGVTTCPYAAPSKSVSITTGSFATVALSNQYAAVLSCSFDPFSYLATGCTVSERFSYRIEMPTGLASSLEISVNSANHTIELQVLDPNIALGEKQITLHGTLPDGQTSSFQFSVWIKSSSAVPDCTPYVCPPTTGIVHLGKSNAALPVATEFNYFLKSGDNMEILFSGIDYTGTTDCSASDIEWAFTSTQTSSQAFIQLDLANLKATVQTGAQADLGTYTITLSAQITAPDSDAQSVLSVVQSVTLNVKQCIGTEEAITLVDSDGSLPDGLDYFLNQQADQSVQFVPLTYGGTTHCDQNDLVYEFSAITTDPAGLDTSFLTLDLSALKVVLNANLVTTSHLGSYTVSLIGKVVTTFQNPASVNPIAQSVTINVKTCSQSFDAINLTDDDGASPADFDYFLGTGTSQIEFSTFSSSSTDCGASDISYQLVQKTRDSDLVQATFVSFDPTTRTLSVLTSDASNLGVYTITVEGSVNAPGATGTTAKQTLQLSVKDCSQSPLGYTITTDPQATETYSVSSGASKTFNFNDFTVTPVGLSETHCTAEDIVYSMKVFSGPGFTNLLSTVSFISLDSAQRQVHVSSADPSIVGSYLIQVVGTITSQTTFQGSYSIELTVITCSATANRVELADSGDQHPQNIVYTLCEGPVEVTAAQVLYDNSIGNTDCTQSDVWYQVNAVGRTGQTTNLVVTDNSRVFTIQTCDSSHLGFFDVTIMGKINVLGSLIDDRQTAQTLVVEVISNGVEIWTPSIYEQVVYKYGTERSSKQFELFKVTSPGQAGATWAYSMTATAESNSGFDTKFITFKRASNQLEVSWETDFLDEELVVTVVVTGKVTTTQGDVYSRQVSFDLVLQLPSCQETPEDLTLGIGQPVSDQFYFFGDEELVIQVAEFSESSSEICSSSDIEYSFSAQPATQGQITNFIKFDAEARQISVATSDTANAGTYFLQITGKIKNQFEDRFLTQTIKLTVLIDPCGKESVMLANANQADVFFEFGQEPLMNQFGFSDTEGGACWADWTYELYLLDTMTKVVETGVKLNGIQVDFDPESLIMTVQSIQDGMPTVLPVQLAVSREGFQNFTQVNFGLHLNYFVDPSIRDKIPFFETLKVSQTGLVTIKFSERLLIPGKPEEINSDVLDVWLLPQTSVDEKFQIFSWNLTSFEINRLQLQVKFEDPLYISSESVDRPDKLQVTIKRPEFFLSYSFRVPEYESFVVGKIPRQYEDPNTATLMANAAGLAGSSAKVVLVGSFAFNLVFSFAMQKIWDTLNSLQIIGYMNYFNTYTPTHVSTFYAAVLEMAELDFIDLTPQAQAVFPFLRENEEQELSSDPERLLSFTIGSTLEAHEENKGEILQTLATILISALLIPAIGVLAIFLYFGRRISKSLRRALKKIKNGLFWNAPLRYWIESYMSISLAYISWFAMPKQWDSSLDFSINLFCISHLVLYFLSPVLFTRFLCRNFDKFREFSFRQKFNDLIQKLNYRQDSSTNFFWIFCYRRLLLTVFIVYLQDTPSLQVVFQMYTIQAVLIGMGMSNVFRWREDRVLEYFNECCILLCCYVYFLFTDFVPSPLVRRDMGNYLLFVTGLNVSVNLFIILYKTITETHRQIKINRGKKARKLADEKKKAQAQPTVKKQVIVSDLEFCGRVLSQQNLLSEQNQPHLSKMRKSPEREAKVQSYQRVKERERLVASDESRSPQRRRSEKSEERKQSPQRKLELVQEDGILRIRTKPMKNKSRICNNIPFQSEAVKSQNKYRHQQANERRTVAWQDQTIHPVKSSSQFQLEPSRSGPSQFQSAMNVLQPKSDIFGDIKPEVRVQRQVQSSMNLLYNQNELDKEQKRCNDLISKVREDLEELQSSLERKPTPNAPPSFESELRVSVQRPNPSVPPTQTRSEMHLGKRGKEQRRRLRKPTQLQLSKPQNLLPENN